MKNFNQHVKKMALHLNMSEEDINNLFLDSANDFLTDYAGTDNAAKVWKATPEFWAWWQQVWVGRDMLVLKRYPNRIAVHNRVQMYQVWHDPKFINTRPNSVVYDGFIRTMKKQNVTLNQMA